MSAELVADAPAAARRVDVAGVAVPADHHVGGRWVGGGEPVVVRSPADGSVLGTVPGGGPSEVALAVAAAAEAFPAWAELGPGGRRAHLDRLGEAIADRVADLALVESTGTGLPLAMLERYVPTTVRRHVDHYAQLACEIDLPTYRSAESVSEVRYAPAGVAAIISTWNGPLSVATSKLGPALAAGDTAVVKPPEWAPFSCALLAEVVAEAGLPPGVVNVVHGLGSVAGAALAAHPGVARISFTGSPGVARSIGASAAANLVPVCFELGGKSPLLVFEDADLDAAAAAMAHQYFHAGQICAAGTRLLVAEAVAEELLGRLRQRVQGLTVGDPRQPATDVGPLITTAHLERVRGYVDRAIADGATVAWGGEPCGPGDTYFAPTLLTDVRPDMEVWREEVFGPVLVWDTFADEDEAVAKANSTDYGLAAHVWTGAAGRGERLADRLVAGIVWVNCSNLMLDVAAPFGGAGTSGIGREGGRWSLEFFSEVKTVVTPLRGGESHLISGR